MKSTALKLLIVSSLVLASSGAMSLSNSVNDMDRESKGDRRGPPPFSKLDLDSDGLITLEEFKQHKLPHGEHENVFKHIDANEDSVISKQEMESHKPPRRNKLQKRNK